MSISVDTMSVCKTYTNKEIAKALTGVVSIDVDNSNDEYKKLILTLQGGTTKELVFEQLKQCDVQIGTNTEDEFTLLITDSNGTTRETSNLRNKTNVEFVRESEHVIKVKFYDEFGETISGNIKGDSTRITINGNNTEYVHKLDIHNIAGGVDTVTTTQNLKGNSIVVRENASNVIDNNKRDYKVDVYETNGNQETKLFTSANLAGESVIARENDANNEYDYKMVFESIGDAKRIITTPNLLGKKWHIGNSIAREKDEDNEWIDTVVTVVSNSENLDLYLNSTTQDVFQRVDTVETKNRWVYKANLKGKNNYEIWSELEGNQGKTRGDYFEWLRNQTSSLKIVWEKPNLYDEDTEVNVLYYYKVDNEETGDAWISRFHAPSDRNYPPNQYAFFNGVKWLCFTAVTTIPALDNKDTTEYIVEYDEKLSRAVGKSRNISTGEYTTLGNWIDVETYLEKPNSYEEIYEDPLKPYTQLGKVQSTIYLSEDGNKNNVLEHTSIGGVSLDGYILTSEFNELIGMQTLNTTHDNIKGAINELNKIIRTDNNVELNSHFKEDENILDLVSAVNYLEERVDGRCVVLSTSLKSYAQSIMLPKNALKEFRVYCFGIPDKPDDNSIGFGFARIEITQDYKTAIITYKDAGNRNTYELGALDNEWATDWINVSLKDVDTITNSVSDILIPIGYVYTQLPNQLAPWQLWNIPQNKWANISEQYADAFFRVEGTKSQAFENQTSSQAQQLPNIKGYWNGNEVGFTYGLGVDNSLMKVSNRSFSRNYSTSRDTTSRAFQIDFDASGYDSTYVDDGEVRPVNQTVRVWKRIQ